jgi:hypothetical protein
MTLPRFNNGKVGELAWHHLNEAFDLIEASSPAIGGARPIASGPLVLAQLGVGVDGAYQWSEVVLMDNGSYEVVVGGRNSTLDGDTRAAPAFSLDGALYSAGAVVMINPRRTKTGKPWWAIVTGMASSQKAMQIVSANAGQTSFLWAYRAREVNIVSTFGQPGGGSVTASPFGPEYTVINLAEMLVDQGGEIGVGSIPPLGVSSERRALRIGAVVPASKVPTSEPWVVFIPNGYRFTCSAGEP